MMSRVSMSTEEGSQPKLPENTKPKLNEKDNAEGGNIWVNLNESGHSKMIETVKMLRA